MLQRRKGILLISFGIACIRDSVRRPSLDRGGRKILTHYSPVCYCIVMVPQEWFHVNTVQLACVRPAASVHPEPGSNSFLFVCPHVNVGLFAFFWFSFPCVNYTHCWQCDKMTEIVKCNRDTTIVETSFHLYSSIDHNLYTNC